MVGLSVCFVRVYLCINTLAIGAPGWYACLFVCVCVYLCINTLAIGAPGW